LTSSSNSAHSEFLKSQIRISIPQIDHRIYLDAFFEIINIQKILYHEILFIIRELSKKESIPATINNVISIKEVWKIFAERLQISIRNHLHSIKDVAESTNYSRHLLLVNVEILEFDTKMIEYSRNENYINKTFQEEIKKYEDIEKSIIDISHSYTYKNAEEGFKKGIHNRLENLWKNCKEVGYIEEELEIHQPLNSSM